MRVFLQLVIGLISLSSAILADKKVCNSFLAYPVLDINPTCFYDPDVDASPEKVAENHGYFMKRIELISPDGYYLDLYHLMVDNNNLENDRPPILIQHSIFSCVKTFLANGNQSLAFSFLNKGYDVWLSNFRTIDRIKGHVNMSIYDPNYWKFSYYEMATYDLSVFLNYIRKTNKSPEKIVYIGHNQGSTLGYIYAIKKSKEAQDNLKAIFSLGSFAFANYVRSPFIRLGLMKVFDVFGTSKLTRGIYDNLVMPYGDKIAQFLCYGFPGFRNLVGCKIIMDLLINGGHSNFNPAFFPTFIYTLKPILPYMAKDIQIMFETGKFEGRDYKASEDDPPVIKYPLEDIKVPVYIFEGSNDAVSDLKDAEKVMSLLNTKKKLIVVDKDFKEKFVHTDSFVSKGISVFIERMLEELDNMKNDNRI